MVFWSWWKTGGSRFSNGPGPSLHLRKAKSHIWLWSPPHTHTHQAHAQKVQLELASLLLNRYVSVMPILLVSDNLWLQAEISYSKPKNMVMVTIILKCFPTSSSVCLSSASFWEGWKVMPVLLLRRIGRKRERLNITESVAVWPRACVVSGAGLRTHCPKPVISASIPSIAQVLPYSTIRYYADCESLFSFSARAKTCPWATSCQIPPDREGCCNCSKKKLQLRRYQEYTVHWHRAGSALPL